MEHDGDDDEGCAGQHSVDDDDDGMKCMVVDCCREAKESERTNGDNDEGSAGQH